MTNMQTMEQYIFNNECADVQQDVKTMFSYFKTLNYNTLEIIEAFELYKEDFKLNQLNKRTVDFYKLLKEEQKMILQNN